MLALRMRPGEGATLAYGGRDRVLRVVLGDPFTVVLEFNGALFLLHRGRVRDLAGTLSTVKFACWKNGGPRLAFELHPDCVLTRHDVMRPERAAS